MVYIDFWDEAVNGLSGSTLWNWSTEDGIAVAYPATDLTLNNVSEIIIDVWGPELESTKIFIFEGLTHTELFSKTMNNSLACAYPVSDLTGDNVSEVAINELILEEEATNIIILSMKQVFIRIGYQPSTHQIAHMTAMEKGWWEEDLKMFGVEKVTDQEFPSGPPEMQAMLNGEIDVAFVGVAPFIAAIDDGLDAKIVAGIQTNGSHLALRPGINYTSPEDLRGLKIATFPFCSVMDIVLQAFSI
ncbi:MAG: ABC transporter substrate-binding protein [Methanophagales archaeon]|nr:ABC transporter substrate-binding protein [Methanophagales archaeon]